MLYNTVLVASQTEWLEIYTASRNATRVLEQLLAYKSQLLHEPTGAHMSDPTFFGDWQFSLDSNSTTSIKYLWACHLSMVKLRIT